MHWKLSFCSGCTGCGPGSFILYYNEKFGRLHFLVENSTRDKEGLVFAFISVSFCEKYSSSPYLRIFYFQESCESESDEDNRESAGEEAILIGDRDSEYEEEQEQGTSEMYRSMDYTKRGYPTTSTPCSETRPSSSHLPKRRRLLSTDALHFSEFSHISESPRLVSTSAVTSGYVSNRFDTLDE